MQQKSGVDAVDEKAPTSRLAFRGSSSQRFTRYARVNVLYTSLSCHLLRSRERSLHPSV